MRIGYQLPTFGAAAEGSAVGNVARHAESIGIDSLWVGDHVVFPVEARSPYPYSTDGSFPLGWATPFLEALTVLAFVAGQTSRVQLGTSVLVLPQRETLLAARQLGTLATLAPERVIVGVGAGWLREEFEALGRPFEARGTVLDEQLVALRGLWGRSGFGFDGAQVSFPPVHMEPLPPSPPALWVGGNSPAALRRAGRYADAWHAAGADDAHGLAGAMRAVQSAAEAVGRARDDVALTARIGMGRGERGEAGLRRRLELLRSLGCEHVMVDPRAADPDDALRCCDVLQEVASKLDT